ncbi:excitatory amino acid transporter 2 [Dermacentor silvarum]|nr:excitatory amino acid transporter 2 [Dermacentor silvarum]
MEETETTRKGKVLTWMKKHLQLSLSIVGIILGLIVGYSVAAAEPNEDITTLISVPGEILLRMYKMLTLPLVFSSVIAALTRVKPGTVGRMMTRMTAYYVASTMLAAFVGTIVVAIFAPGKQILQTDVSKIGVSGLDSFLDFVRNMFPENIVQACFQLHRTVRVAQPPRYVRLGVNASELEPDIVRKLQYSDGLNIFGIIVFCSVFGLFAGLMGEVTVIMVDFFSVLNVLTMKLAYLVMWYFPIGVVFLLSASIARGDALGEQAINVGAYIGTVMTGLVIHSFIVLPLIYYTFVRKNPLVFAKNLLHAFVTAFGTSDSVATLPVTFMCLEQNNKLDRRVTRFVAPIASAFNLDGTALYAAIGTIFIANLSGIELDFAHYLAICVAAALTSFANRGIPNAGVITMILVLKAGGIGPSHIGLLLAVDWIMNRCRTCVNVFSQSIAVAIVHHSVEMELKRNQNALEHWPVDELTLERKKYTLNR